MSSSLRRLVLTAVALAVSVSVAWAESLEDFYNGSTVTILVGHPPGGSFDLYAQLASRHLGKHIPGNPNVVVQSMPGGGGSLAATYFANKAPTDGSFIALLPEPLSSKQLMEPEASHWDMHQMRYIGRLTNIRSVMMVRKDAPAQTIEDLKTIGGPIGCTGTTSASSQTGAVIGYFADLNFKVVCGYQGISAVILALVRGEIDFASAVWPTWSVEHQDEIASGAIRPIMQFGMTPVPEIKDVPLAIDLITDPSARSAFNFFIAGAEIGRSLLAPPNLDDEKYQMFIDAFEGMATDPEFLEDAESRGIPLVIGHAAELEEVKNSILKTPAEDVQLLAKALEEGFQ